MSLEKLRAVLLSDFYGNLLTEKQQRFLKLHYENDLSYGEIAECFGITRQAVHDSVKSSEAALEQYEEKLGLLAAFQRQQEVLSDILERLKALEPDVNNVERMRTIQTIRKRLGLLMN